MLGPAGRALAGFQRGRRSASSPARAGGCSNARVSEPTPPPATPPARVDDEGSYLLLLRETAQLLVRSHSQTEALGRLVAHVASRLGLDVCSIYLVHEGELVLRATHGLRPESVDKVRMPLSEGMTGLVAETERPLFTSRADEHPRFKYFPETGEERFRSFGGVPLLRRGQCVGVLTVQTVREYAFKENEVVALETLAEQVVGVIDVTRRLTARLETAELVRPAARGRPARGTLIGAGTSPGIGVGRAVLFGADPFQGPPAARPVEDPRQELARFAEARARAVAELVELGERLEAGGGPAAGIFRAQAEVLEDGAVEEAVRRLVLDAREPVERAVHAAFEDMAARLRAVPNERVREKAWDLLDARGQLLMALGVAGGGMTLPTGEPAVLVASVLTPAQTARLDPSRVVAIVTEHGSLTSHASILARSLGIPSVVGVPGLLRQVGPGERLLVDGENGFVFVDPAPDVENEYAARARAAREAAARLQGELEARRGRGPLIPGVRLFANAGLPGELRAAGESGADGVGLLRTELHFLQHSTWPDEATQVGWYREAVREAPRGGPVVFRLLDTGGDKLLPYAEPRQEPNPILGLRSIRLLLTRPEVARTQLRALLRVAAEGQAEVQLLVPLVTATWELAAVRQLMEEEARALHVRAVPLGMMIESPSVLYQLPELLPLSDFVSLGTNDLTQYLLAVDRDNEHVRQYYSSYHPAVLRALAAVMAEVGPTGKPLSVCGEMASDPLGALALLALGYRRLSCRPRAIPLLRCLVHCVAADALPRLRKELLAAATPGEVERRLRRVLRREAPFLLEA